MTLTAAIIGATGATGCELTARDLCKKALPSTAGT